MRTGGQIVGKRKTFLPKDVRGCVTWLRSDVGITTVSGKVSAWVDQSGHGANLSQATAGVRPVYNASSANMAGRPTISLSNATQTVMTFDGAISSSVSDYTAFIAHYTAAVAASARYFLLRSDVTFVLAQRSATGGDAGYYDGSWKEGVASALPQVQAWSLTSGAGAMYVNGASRFTGQAYTQKALPAGSQIGFGANTPDAEIAEIIIYNRALSASERQKVTKYLGGRYAISVA